MCSTIGLKRFHLMLNAQTLQVQSDKIEPVQTLRSRQMMQGSPVHRHTSHSLRIGVTIGFSMS